MGIAHVYLGIARFVVASALKTLLNYTKYLGIVGKGQRKKGRKLSRLYELDILCSSHRWLYGGRLSITVMQRYISDNLGLLIILQDNQIDTIQ